MSTESYLIKGLLLSAMLGLALGMLKYWQVLHCYNSIVTLPLSATGPLGTLATITLQLDPDYSPPASIPEDPTELIYNAPAMDHMLEPVKVRVLNSSGHLVTDSVTVVATTVLASSAGLTGNPGDTYNGTLCQHNLWTHRFLTCRFLDDNCTELSCNTTDPDYPLGKVEVVSENGIAEFPRLLHTEPSTNGQRILRFYAEYEGEDDTVETNALNVTRKFMCGFLAYIPSICAACNLSLHLLVQCKLPSWKSLVLLKGMFL